MSEAVDLIIDMTDLSRSIGTMSQKINSLTRKLDDPRNQSDPRKGEAEAKRFRMVYERSEDQKKLVKIAGDLEASCLKYLDDETRAAFIDEMAIGFGTTALGVIVPRIPEVQTLSFFRAWVVRVAFHRDAGHFTDRRPPF